MPWHWDSGLRRWQVSFGIVAFPFLDDGRDFRADLRQNRTLSRSASTCFEPLPRPCGCTPHGVGLDASVALLGAVLLAGRSAT